MNWLILVALLLSGTALIVAPYIAPRYSLFGVRVEPAFRRSTAARRAVFRFRLTVFVALVAMAALLMVAPGWTLALVCAPNVMIAVGVGAWIWQYRALRRFALSGSVAREEMAERRVELSTKPDRIPLWFCLGLLPFVVLAAVALYLQAHWTQIPERFPVHWGIEGRPDGWADRTVHGVFGPLILCAVLNAWLMVLSTVTWHGSRRSVYREAAVQCALIAEAALTAIFAVGAMVPVWHLNPDGSVAVTLGLVPFVVVFAVWRAGQVNADPSAADDQTDPDCWHGGILYFNRKDAAVAVPRRDGFGFTLNLARPTSWILAVGSAATIVGCILWIK